MLLSIKIFQFKMWFFLRSHWTDNLSSKKETEDSDFLVLICDSHFSSFSSSIMLGNFSIIFSKKIRAYITILYLFFFNHLRKDFLSMPYVILSSVDTTAQCLKIWKFLSFYPWEFLLKMTVCKSVSHGKGSWSIIGVDCFPRGPSSLKQATPWKRPDIVDGDL